MHALEEVKKALRACFDEQTRTTAQWHEADPSLPEAPSACTLAALPVFVLREHYYNFLLWHVEDEARRKDVGDSVIADCKRRIDRLNQQRNDCMEEVDRCICEILRPLLPGTAASQNTETAGMAVDRLSILALKIYHMEEQTLRTDVDAAHIRACEEKLAILLSQRQRLAAALLELVDDYAGGRKAPALYAQFKMYNDPSLNPQLYGNKETGKV